MTLTPYRISMRFEVLEVKEFGNIAKLHFLTGSYIKVISNRVRKGQTISLKEVRERLDEICESLRDETLDLISQQFNYAHRPRNPSEGNRYAREALRGRWTPLAGKLGVVGGKTLLARISEWTQRSFGIGLNAFVLARFMRKGGI